MVDASQFMRSSDSHGHSERFRLKLAADAAEHIAMEIHEDNGIEYRNLPDALRDWILTGAEEFVERRENPDLTRAVSAFVASQRMEIRLEKYDAERELIRNTEAAFQRRIEISNEELRTAFDTIQNAGNREDFQRVLYANRIEL